MELLLLIPDYASERPPYEALDAPRQPAREQL